MKTASDSELVSEANEFSKNDKITFLESKAGLGDRFRENQNAPARFDL